MNIQGKTALITGSAKRVGRLTALELARRGARIGIHYRSHEEDARKTLAAIRETGVDGEIFQAELADPREVDGMFAKVEQAFGQLDILVNNASVFDPGTMDEETAEDWDRQMNTNARAPFLVAQRAARLMMKSGAGKIINLADVAGELVWPRYFTYSVSKAALIAVNRGLAKALAPAIQVNAIAPGPVLFPESYTEEQKQSAIQRTLLKRAGTPQDIVNAIVFLIESDYITGELLHVDGGRHVMP